MGKQFEKAVSLAQLQKSAMRCRRGVRKKESVSNFCNKSIVRCKTLRDDILSGNYSISKYVKFTIYEPKKRKILATRIRDRVWQESMIRNGVYDDLTRSNIYDNGACQIGKGTSFTISRTSELLRRYYRKTGSNTGWACHLDAKKYFPSTPHKTSKSVISKTVGDPKFSEMLYEIIDSFTDERSERQIADDIFGERGTGLGSPVSQLVQLALPSRIDHYAKQNLHLKYYVRYNDDVLIWDEDKKKIADACEWIIAEAAKLGVTVVSKEGIYPIKRGLKFLQKRFILTGSGKVVIRLPKDKLAGERRTLRGMKRKVDSGELTMDDVNSHYQSWVSGLLMTKSYGAVRATDKFFTETFRERPEYSFRKGK